MTTPPVPPPPLPEEPPAPPAQGVVPPGVAPPAPPAPPKSRSSSAIGVEIANGVYILHRYFVTLKSGRTFETYSDEHFDEAMEAFALGTYSGKMLHLPGWVCFFKDRVPMDQIERLHIVQKMVSGREGVNPKDLELS